MRAAALVRDNVFKVESPKSKPNLKFLGYSKMRSFLTAVAILFSASSAFAGSCVMKIAFIDKALSVGNVGSVEKVKQLRKQVEAMHELGDHNGNEIVLKEARELSGIKG